MEDSIRVVVRVRPSENQGSCGSGTFVTIPSKQNVKLANGKEYCFDHAFSETSTQEDIFEKLGASIVDSCLRGYNGTIFAYGLTGSGKTYTMLGPFGGQCDEGKENFNRRGVIPRSIEYLFLKLTELSNQYGASFNYEVKCTYVQLYQEVLTDLVDQEHRPLTLRFGVDSEIYVEGAQERRISSISDALTILRSGWKNRHMGETAMNEVSSRSHAIFTVRIKTKYTKNDMVTIKTSILNLVDLAGSERQKYSSKSVDRIKESSSINNSLLVLGRVIRVLTDSEYKIGAYVPYRDSNLTFLLRNSIGGNARTYFIVTLHPDEKYSEEISSSIHFAHQIKMVKNEAKINEDVELAQINARRTEIMRLRLQLNSMTDVKDENKRLRSQYENLVNENSKLNAAIKKCNETVLVERNLLQKYLLALNISDSYPYRDTSFTCSAENTASETDHLMQQSEQAFERIFHLIKEVDQQKDVNDHLRALLAQSEKDLKVLSNEVQIFQADNEKILLSMEEMRKNQLKHDDSMREKQLLIDDLRGKVQILSTTIDKERIDNENRIKKIEKESKHIRDNFSALHDALVKIIFPLQERQSPSITEVITVLSEKFDEMNGMRASIEAMGKALRDHFEQIQLLERNLAHEKSKLYTIVEKCSEIVTVEEKLMQERNFHPNRDTTSMLSAENVVSILDHLKRQRLGSIEPIPHLAEEIRQQKNENDHLKVLLASKENKMKDLLCEMQILREDREIHSHSVEEMNKIQLAHDEEMHAKQLLIDDLTGKVENLSSTIKFEQMAHEISIKTIEKEVEDIKENFSALLDAAVSVVFPLHGPSSLSFVEVIKLLGEKVGEIDRMRASIETLNKERSDHIDQIELLKRNLLGVMEQRDDSYTIMHDISNSENMHNELMQTESNIVSLRKKILNLRLQQTPKKK